MAWSWSPPKSENTLPPSKSQALAKLAQHGRRSVCPLQSLWVPTGGWNQHLSARLCICLSKHPFIHPLSIPPFTTCPLAVHPSVIPPVHPSIYPSSLYLCAPPPVHWGPLLHAGPFPGHRSVPPADSAAAAGGCGGALEGETPPPTGGRSQAPP